MITRFKIFENQKIKEPEIGDWVIMTHWWSGQQLHKYIDTTPGRVISKESISEKTTIYIVQYGEVGDASWIDDNFGIQIWKKEFSSIKGFQEIDIWIKYIFEDTEELEMFIAAKKYNL